MGMPENKRVSWTSVVWERLNRKKNLERTGDEIEEGPRERRGTSGTSRKAKQCHKM